MDKARKYRDTVLCLQMGAGQNHIHKSLESTEERSLAMVRYSDYPIDMSFGVSICVHIRACVSICILKSWINLGCIFSYTYVPCFRVTVFHWLGITNFSMLLGQQALEISFATSSALELQTYTTTPGFLFGC